MNHDKSSTSKPSKSGVRFPRWIFGWSGQADAESSDSTTAGGSNSSQSPQSRPGLGTMRWESEKQSFRSRMLQPTLASALGDSNKPGKTKNNKLNSEEAVGIALTLFPEVQVPLEENQSGKPQPAGNGTQVHIHNPSDSELTSISKKPTSNPTTDANSPGMEVWCSWLGKLTGIHCICIDLDHVIDVEEKFNNEVFLREKTRRILEHKAIKIKRLAIGRQLGQGGNGRVYRGIYLSAPVAVKEMICTKANREEAESFVKEFEHLKALRHPNIVQFYGAACIEDPVNGAQRRLLVMELASQSLRDLVRSSEHDGINPLPIATYLNWARQVASGLSYVHDTVGMIHFDIKPANVLIDVAGIAKICDLGVAKIVGETSGDIMFSHEARVGTPSYMAPELLHGRFERIDAKVDVYSFGMLLWEVIHRRSPHPKTWNLVQLFNQVAQNNYRPEIDQDVPSNLSMLIQVCWHDQPTSRPSMLEIRQELDYLLRYHGAQFGAKVAVSVSDPNTNISQLVVANTSPDLCFKEGEPVTVYSQEAECFLTDGSVARRNPDGSYDVEFDDGQPPQYGIDSRNILALENLQHHQLAIQHLESSQCNSTTNIQDELEYNEAEYTISFGNEDDSDLDDDDDDETGATQFVQHLQEQSNRLGFQRILHHDTIGDSRSIPEVDSSTATYSSNSASVLLSRLRGIGTTTRKQSSREVGPISQVFLQQPIGVNSSPMSTEMQNICLNHGLKIVSSMGSQYYRAFHIPTKTVVAVNTVCVSKKSHAAAIRREVERYLTGLQHPSLVRFHNSMVIPNNSTVLMVFEYLSGSSVSSLLDNLEQALVEAEIHQNIGVKQQSLDSESVVRHIGPIRSAMRSRMIKQGIPVPRLNRSRKSPGDDSSTISIVEVLQVVARDISSALAYLHVKRIAHHNVNWNSIMFQSKSLSRAKLLGLRFSKTHDELLNANSLTSTMRESDQERGDELFLSPETRGNGMVAYSADVWGLGMTLLCIAIGRAPIELVDWYGFQNEMKNGSGESSINKSNNFALACDAWNNVRSSLPSNIVRVVEECLNVEPLRRPTSVWVSSKCS